MIPVLLAMLSLLEGVPRALCCFASTEFILLLVTAIGDYQMHKRFAMRKDIQLLVSKLTSETIQLHVLNFYISIDVSAYGGSKYGIASVAPTLTNFACYGNETSLSGCTYTTTSSGQVDAIASVRCTPKTICENAGHTGCCVSGCNTGTCYCDDSCHFFQDCCEGIETTCPCEYMSMIA